MCKGGAEQVRGPEIIVPTKVFEGLKQLAQTAGVPLRTALLAAHMKVMSVVHGTSDVLSGLVTNGRQEELDAEQMVGLFLNSLPFRMKLVGGSWLELCRQTFAAEQEIIPHRRFPLVEAQKLAGGQSLFETLFDFVNFHVFRGLEGYPNCRFEEGHYFEANNFTVSSTFMLDSTSTELEFHFDYDPEQLPEEQIRDFCGYYLNTLAAMASDPTARYESFSPLSETENKKLWWIGITQQ
jgi:microcystin synthetase protein McyA